MAYADVEKMLVAYLPTAVALAPQVGVATPADPEATYSWLPFVRVQRIGGPRSQGIDRARVILEFFGPDYATASQLGAQVSALFDGPIFQLRSTEGRITSAQTDSAPSWVPYDDVRVTRFQSHHTLVVQSMK
ncbi:MAG: hypothetical protein ACXVGC_00130 [Mycobacteriaceae bacterium]